MAAAAVLVVQALAYAVLMARDRNAKWTEHLWGAAMMCASVAGSLVLVALY